jgi:hypothetical protein
MTDELITPDNVSLELLMSILDEVYMEPKVDDDGDLYVTENITCHFLLSEKKDIIQLYGSFLCKPETSMEQRLECVNKVNSTYVLVSSSADNKNHLLFAHDIFIAGGITKKNFILVTRKFIGIPRNAVHKF